MKKHKNKILAGVVAAILLVFAFWYGGDSPSLRGWSIKSGEENNVILEKEPTAEEIKEAENAIADIAVKEKGEPATEENKPQNPNGIPMTSTEKIALAEKIAEASSPDSNENNNSVSENPKIDNENITAPSASAKTPQQEVNSAENKNIAAESKEAEPRNNEAQNKTRTCTLSVRCDTILQNMAWLDKEKTELVPEDGVIFAEKTVEFNEGESVFNLLLREMKLNKIHMEYENTPMYNSAYIEGIGNLYEFDCGELSGWMYKVNGQFPNYGCSRYILKDGDKVEWVYTCDLGNDVGGGNSAGNGR